MLNLNEILCEENRKLGTEEIERLAVSIGNVGLLNPLTLAALPEPIGGKSYRVLAGRRRYRALELLRRYELADDEYRVIDPGDPDLVSFVENAERKNLSLVEEVQQLMALRAAHDVPELSSLLGRSRAYVALRLNLGNLAGKWRDVLAKPDDYPQWRADQLALIAREPAKIQREIEYWIPQALSTKEIMTRLSEQHRQLSAAPFDAAVCSGCARRSDAQGDLFDDLRSKAVCLDPACWSRRCVSACKTILAEHPELSPIRADGLSAGDAEERFAASLKLRQSPHPVEFRRPLPGEQPNALIVRGPGIGSKVVALCPKQGSRLAADPAPASAERSAAEIESDLALRRGRLALRKLADVLDSSHVAQLVRDRVKDDLPRRLTRLALAVGLPPHPDELDALADLPGDLASLTDLLCAAACSRAAEALRWCVQRPAAAFDLLPGKSVCNLLGFDWEGEYRRPAAAEIPDPKELAAARLKEKTKRKK